jgi:hypothetical protein
VGLAHSPSIVMNGLVLCLDAGNRKSYPGSGTTWTDLSGRGNTGTLTNGPTYSSSNGGSLVFDGVDDYTDCGSSLLLLRPFTINSWVYFNSLTGWQTFVGQDTSQATILGSFYFQKVNNTGGTNGRTFNTFGLSLINTSLAEIYCYDTVAVQTGIWYNYCVSVSTTQILLYRNGNLITTTNNSSTMAPTTGSLYVGCGYYNSVLVDYVNGRIPSTLIYNRALTAAEIQQNFNALRGRFGI